MSKEIANRSSGAVAALAGLKRGIQNTRQAIPASSTMPILRMGKDGAWVYGAENIEVEDDSLWAINPLSIHHGFVCWTNYPASEKKKNELLGEVYAPMTSAPIDPLTLPEHDWPWRPATTVQLKCTVGEDEGEEVIYKPSSVGGSNVMQTILDAIEKKLDEGTDEIVPIVRLTTDHYNHKQYGKTYVPVFEIVDWMTIDGPVPGDDVEDAAPTTKAVTREEPTEEPARRARRTEGGTRAATQTRAPEPAQEPEDEAGEAEPATEGRVRRRRRA